MRFREKSGLKILIACFVLFAGLAPALCAAGPVESAAPATTVPRRLTLANAEELLLQRNLAIAASRYQIEAGRAARLIASYKPNPVLSIGGEQMVLSRQHFIPDLVHTNTDLAAQSTSSTPFAEGLLLNCGVKH